MNHNMFLHYLRVALRGFRRHKLYSLVNIGCLAIGIAAAMTILLYVLHEHSYDRWQANGKRIFALSGTYSYGTSTYSSNYVSYVTTQLVQAADSRVEGSVRAYGVFEKPVLARIDDPNAKFKVKSPFLFADSNFFQFFSYRLLKGNPATVLKRPYTVVLPERAAKQYFGNSDPIGKVLLYNDRYRLEVTGVSADPPSNSTIDYDGVASFSSLPTMKEMAAEWQYQTLGAGNFRTWFLLKDAADSGKVEQTINRLGNQPDATRGTSKDIYRLTALTDVHLKANFGDDTDIKYLTIFPLVAGLILLLALINYMSLATARAGIRAKEVGVRKVMGAGRTSIAAQFYTESTVYALLAFVIGIGLFLLLRAYFSQLVALKIDKAFLYSPPVLVGFATLLVLVIVVSGGYPSLVLSAFKPAAVLYGKFSRRRGGERVRKGFLIFQFSISMSLILCSVIIQKEMYYIRHADTGVNRENILLVHFDNHFRHYPAFKREVESLPGVVKAATANYSLYSAYIGYLVTPKSPAKPFMLAGLNIDNNFIDLLGLQWKQRPGLNDFYDGKHIVLNEQAVTSLGLQGNPVGQTVNVNDDRVVSGVLRDFNFEALRGKIGPLCLFAGRDTDSAWGNRVGGCLMVRVQAHVNLPTLLASLQKIYGSYDRMNPFDYSFLDETFDSQYKAEDRLAGLFGIFTAITIIIACLGLFALATFAAEQRLREIGIRKVLGASVGSIGALLSRDFLRPVLVAIAIASPVAWWIMHRWLQDFAYRTAISWWVFPAAGALLLLVALGTVLFRVLGAARMSPVNNLRSE
jgi:putative ABC transport system permease protein